MFKSFKPRLLATCAIALFISACASDPSGQTSHRVDSIFKPSQQQASSKDVWQRVRNGYAMPDLYNAEVTSKENYYAQRADYVGRMASRSGDFMYLIMNEVERRKMPSEIALLPFVESAFVTTAQSPVKAAGLWQFMPATGRDFSLQQNHFADQRNDVVASTDAALTFLQRLHDQFGDWHLALAAYNWGPGNVSKAVRRAQANGLAGTYEDIKMPTETRQYVPKLQAIKNIVNNPAQYGISLPDINNNLRHEVVTVTRDIDVATAARLSGLDTEAFKRINPAYKKSVITASLGAKILVPAERADDLRRAFNDRSQTLASVTTYSTYNLESLDDIASKFNTNASNLRYLNNIPSYHNYVKSGSALLVPRTSNSNSQDIPYGALTAGLSTTAGDIGLSNGDFIEQPTLVVANTDETTRSERSGIINPQVNTLNDPLPSSSVLIVRNTPTFTTPANPVIETPVAVVTQPSTVNPLLHNSPQPTITPEVAVNDAVNPLLHNSPTAAATVTEVATTNPVNPLLHNSPVVADVPPVVAAATTEVNPALTPFVAIAEAPEVIEPAPAKVVAVKKPVIVKAKPAAQVKVVKNTATVGKVVKVSNVTPVKAKFIPVKVNNKPVEVKKSTVVNKKTAVVAPAAVVKKKTTVAPTVVKKADTKKTAVVDKTPNKPAVKPAVKAAVVTKKAVVTAVTPKKVVKK